MRKRLETILSYVRPCNVFADIGCDHGFIAVGVLKKGICRRVIAADISPSSLNKAVNLADNERIDGLITVVSDGFKNINEKVDEAVIAGMGGEEICKILTDCRYLPERLILQPMKNADKLRRLLYSTFRYPITDDYLFFDGEKYYDLIVADRRGVFKKYSENDLYFGKGNLSGNPDFNRYLKNLSATYQAALEVITDEGTKRELTEKLNVINGLISDEDN